MQRFDTYKFYTGNEENETTYSEKNCKLLEEKLDPNY